MPPTKNNAGGPIVIIAKTTIIQIPPLDIIKEKIGKNLFWPSVPNLVTSVPGEEAWSLAVGDPGRPNDPRFYEQIWAPTEIPSNVRSDGGTFWSLLQMTFCGYATFKLCGSTKRSAHHPASTLPAGYGTLRARLRRAQ